MASHKRAMNSVAEYGRSKGKARLHVDATAWVDAGPDLLRSEGIEHFRVERLAGELGITTGSFYGYFNSKTDLHAAILERRDDRLGGRASRQERPGKGARLE